MIVDAKSLNLEGIKIWIFANENCCHCSRNFLYQTTIFLKKVQSYYE